MPPRIFGLDFLRALAILAVLFAHYCGLLYPHLPWWFSLVGHGGFYGVELFFVLSGFLIGRILIRIGDDLARGGAVANFYLRRWFRTLPAFWLFLGLNVLLELYLHHHRLGLFEILAHGFFLRTLTDLHASFFFESWSLAVEEWFYLLFPAALWLGLHFRKNFDHVFLSAATAFLLFSTLARMHSALDPLASWTTTQRMIVLNRFDAPMFGMLAAWLSLRFPDKWRAYAQPSAVAGGLLLLGLYASLWRISGHTLAYSADSFFARTFRFSLVSLGFAMLLPWHANWKLPRENFLSSAVRRIALWSYAIYLVHWLVFQIATALLFPGWQTSAPQAFSCFLIMLAATITISALLYRFFESPCTRLRDRFAAAR